MGALFLIALAVLPGILLGLFQLLATKSVTKWGALVVSIVPSLLLLFFSYAAFVKGKEEEEYLMGGEIGASVDGWLLLTIFFVNLPFLIASISITLTKTEWRKDE